MTENLIVCIDHYEKIKGLSREIENIHHTSIFILFLGGGVIICSGLFQLTLVEIGGLEFFMLISFLMCMLTEQFIYCWFGNDIIYKSAQISNAAYNTPWTECDLRFKKILLQFLIQTKKPIQIKVGGLFAMSIDAFKSVVQSSYSYFTLLKRLQDMS
uniref:Odorant receptor OR12 n=1 Tax=Colaphellus bowringi TaxID=561076 RepID=A0A0S3J317_9CUCU|nr:odorant receptor OR12 [Colaphellus bowringi]